MNFDENHFTNEYPEGNEKLKALNYGNSNFGDVYKDVKNTLEEARSISLTILTHCVKN